VGELRAAGPAVPAGATGGLASPEAEAMLAALRGRGDETVERLLRANELRWRSLSDADRRTVESLLLAIASRLLDRPARRLADEREDLQAAHVPVLRELFALGAPDAQAGPERG
jgi:hypothetical protein